jgi:uncharacterized protein YndB with AHSA1/START domain
MTKAFEAKTVIAAPVERIWFLLTDTPGYPAWNTTVDKVDGTLALGHKLKVFPKLTPGKGFGVKVKELVPNQRMVWAGGFPPMFKGVRTYTLVPVSGGIQFTMREELSGLMAPLVAKSLPDMQPAFDEFAAALKRRAES